MKARLLVCAAVLTLTASCKSSAASDETSTSGASTETGDEGDETGDGDGDEPPPANLIVDDQGRALILHGINVQNASKSQPDRLPTITQDDVARMAHDWGFNVVRLLIFWDAVEPAPGAYDDAYLAAIAERIAWFEAEDIDVILDMHQDVYSEVFCCDGAPAWAVRDDGEPFEPQSLWDLNYTQPAVQRAFDNFWAGDAGAHPDVQEHYVLMWQHVAATFAGTPNLIGYELMNEPHPGSAWTLADFEAPAPTSELEQWGEASLTPFYQRVTDAIREVDADSWLFVEPRYGAPANGQPAVLGVVVDPREGGPRIGYFPHLYPFETELQGTYSPTNQTLPKWEAARAAEAEVFGGPLLLGEFGVLPDWSFGPELLEQTLAVADRVTTGWTYWSYDVNGRGIVDAQGEERPAAGILTRPYARAVAGTPLSHVYDPATRELAVEFEHRGGVEGPTLIYIPASRWYADGWEIVVDDPEDSWTTTWDASREILSLTTDPAESPHEVLIRPAG